MACLGCVVLICHAGGLQRPVHVNAHCAAYITAEDLEREKQNRKQGYRARSARSRDKSYLHDHQHILVQVEGAGPEYCCICRHHTHKALVSALQELERRWAAQFENFVDEAVAAKEEAVQIAAEWQELKRWEGLAPSEMSARQTRYLLDLVVEDLMSTVVAADAVGMEDTHESLMDAYARVCQTPVDIKPRLAGEHATRRRLAMR